MLADKLVPLYVVVKPFADATSVTYSRMSGVTLRFADLDLKITRGFFKNPALKVELEQVGLRFD
jgi:hypothetical protein